MYGTGAAGNAYASSMVTESVICLKFDSKVLTSGNADFTIKVWDLRMGGAFTLHGHHDWVNAVQLWDSTSGAPVSLTNDTIPAPDAPPQIGPSKMLFSASDDGMIKLWDLNPRTCVRELAGHLGQVQSIQLLLDSTDKHSPLCLKPYSIGRPRPPAAPHPTRTHLRQS
ncbi:WD40-repeat-containing domain protein [Infundibulicybe gibba]|nr:WD40-repeat-containing domain protein [Infundibulicybe gibba]